MSMKTTRKTAAQKRAEGLRREAAHLDLMSLATKDQSIKAELAKKVDALYAQADALYPRPS